MSNLAKEVGTKSQKKSKQKKKRKSRKSGTYAWNLLT